MSEFRHIADTIGPLVIEIARNAALFHRRRANELNGDDRQHALNTADAIERRAGLVDDGARAA